jgi:hypothetical protein
VPTPETTVANEFLTAAGACFGRVHARHVGRVRLKGGEAAECNRVLNKTVASGSPIRQTIRMARLSAFFVSCFLLIVLISCATLKAGRAAYVASVMHAANRKASVEAASGLPVMMPAVVKIRAVACTVATSGSSSTRKTARRTSLAAMILASDGLHE